ncbi:MAG: thiamine pyrophosphate-dependent enzyme [Myxococcota bacterium]
MAVNYHEYLREKMMPHIWCAGCTHGIVTKALIRAIDKAKLNKDKIVLVSGIGCASRMPGYLDFNTLHTTHGRALAFATGVKLANPELNVIVVAGDGDAVAIGGNHFIHACNRNIDITLVVLNNNIYGMTGGQRSPTTYEGDISSTSVYGSIGNPIDVVNLALGAGATFVARSTSYHVQQLESYIYSGIMHKGFSVIDAVSACYTAYGRRNKHRYKSAADMLTYMKNNALNFSASRDKSAEELKGKILVGIFRDIAEPEYCEEYAKMVSKAKSR